MVARPDDFVSVVLLTASPALRAQMTIETEINIIHIDITNITKAQGSKLQIKQLDVGMSPPTFSFTLIVTLTFDPDL